MDNFRILEDAQNDHDRLRLLDVAKKLIAEAFTLIGTLHEPCNIIEFNNRRDFFLGLAHQSQLLAPVVGNGNNANIWINRGKRIICDRNILLGEILKSVDLPTLGRPTMPREIFAIWVELYYIFIKIQS